MKVTRRSDLYLVMGTAVVFVAVALVASLEKALAAGVTFAVFSAVIQAKWDSRHDARFWIVISIFAFVHILAITLITFPEPRFGLVSLPLALIDGFVMFGILNWIEKRFPRSGGRAAE
jgi:hypothetical protein